MQRPDQRSLKSARSPFHALAVIAAGLAWIAAATMGAIIAVVFAATVVVIGIMASALLAFSAAAMKARRSARVRPDPSLIEARNIGGHSWVAYGWDGRP